MAKIENTRMTVSLDAESKRIFRNLTKAIDQHNTIYRDDVQLKYRDHESGLDGQPVRLAEPAEDPALGDDNENHSQEETTKYARGGYVSANTMPEPDKGSYIPGNRVELDASTINALQAAVGKYNALR